MAKRTSSQPVPARCPECGAPLPDAAGSTCPNCGAHIQAAADAATLTRSQRQAALQERSIRRVITAGLLLAITLLLAFTRIGFIPVPTPAANATITHIPAIIGGILEGPLVGLIVGLGFGFASFMNATVPMFKDPLVAILPRLLIGVVSAWSYVLLRRAKRGTLMALWVVLLAFMLGFSYQVGQTIVWVGILVAALAGAGAVLLFQWTWREDARIIALAIVAVLGSLTNTVLVLGIATLRGYLAPGVALGVGLTHGVPEAIVSAIVVVAVVAALRQIGQRRRGSRLRSEVR